MSIFDAHHMEFSITSGHITIMTDDAVQVPAYWSHPRLGVKFSGIVLIHDWWGVTEDIRQLSNYLAQMGYYVIVPDLFGGQTASTPKQAIRLFDEHEKGAFERVNAALSVLETHSQSNHKVAAIGVGMGGSLAFEAAIKRPDLEASIAFSGFPQRYLKQFKNANTPILAFFGSEEPYTKPVVIKAMEKVLQDSKLAKHHKVKIVDGIGHEFFSRSLSESQQHAVRRALNQTLDFLEDNIGRLHNSAEFDDII